MITLIIDLHTAETPPPGSRLAAQVDDYVPVRIQIQRALAAHEALAVYITHPTLVHWFEDLQDYPQSAVRWQSIDPAQDFTAFFEVAPAALFSAEVIKALDLPSLNRPTAGSSIDPVAWILDQRLGPLWGQTVGSALHLTQLVATIVERSEPYPSAVLPLIHHQLEAWAEQHRPYQALRSPTLAADAQQLVLRWAFQRYDGRYLPTEYQRGLPLSVGETQPIHFLKVLREQATLIKAYWNSWFAAAGQTGDSLNAALKQMAGLSMAELHALTHVLDQKPELLNQELWIALKTTFAQLPDAAAVLRDVATRIPPALPQLPDHAWAMERWLSWATQEYLPYFAWVIRQRQPREHQQACAYAFSAWLVEQYPAWLNSSSSPVVLNQYGTMRQVLETDSRAVVVWLVIDGLTWWQGALIQEACRQHGLHLHSQQTGIAALPSITSVSKRVLVTGVTNLRSDQTIAQAAREQLRLSGVAHYVTYDRPAALQQLKQDADLRCYIVLDNMIDTIAHQTATFTDDLGIQGHLAGLAQFAAQMQHVCAQQGRHCHILIGSDHGSTLLPAQATALQLPRSTEEIPDLAEEEHAAPTKPLRRSTRAAIIFDPHLMSPGEDWYVLDKHRYQLDQHYIVPRGYQYVGHRPTGWTHGGLTPEEVIVPLLHLTPEAPQIQPLEIHLAGGLQAFQATELTVEIVNPNPFPFAATRITWSDPCVIQQFAHIPPSSRVPVQVLFPASMTQQAELLLEWQLESRVFGVEYSQRGQQTITVRRLQQQDTFDDFFADE